MNFEEWVKKKTPKEIAKALNVDTASVSYWLSRTHCPRPKQMKAMVAMSGGKIKYNDIINHYLKNK